MKLKQLSLFLQNEPGALTAPCRHLAAAGINLVTFCLADAQQFGILRIITSDATKAKEVLEQAGCLVKTTEVVAIEVEDRPGGLAHVLEILERNRVNVEYVYAFTIKQGNKGTLVFRFTDPDAAIAILNKEGVTMLESEELLRRSGN
jgi:hypothetical protein